MADTTTNGMGARDDSALAEAESLVQQAGDVRSRLMAERDDLLAKVGRIDTMLARLPAAHRSDAPNKPATTPSPRTAARADIRMPGAKTIPGILLAIIRATPGITSKKITAAAEKKRPKL